MSTESETELRPTVEAAEARHGEALAALFERTSTPCNCQYWHFTGDKNAWLERLFHAPELNRAAFMESLSTSAPHGIVALHDERAIGWLKLTPAEHVQKLYDQRLYKGLSIFQGPRDGVLTIGCLLVDEDYRRRGVAKALVQGAIAYAHTLGSGIRAIEAFPRRTERMEPAELWTGPPSIFLSAGFEVVSDFAPYPVLRYAVSGMQA